MKKVLFTICIILVALSVMAPAPDKAEKLKVDDNTWDSEGGEFGFGQFVVSMSSQFGAATAGERADFKVGAKLTVEAGDKPYDLAGDRGIQKVDGAVKDADNFIAIEPLRIDWIEGESFDGVAFVTYSVSLYGPNGKVMGDPVSTTTEVKIAPNVKVDETGWDYDLKTKVIVVPLLANPNIVDKGYKVTVYVDVWNTDDKQTFAGSGWGSTEIVKVEDQDYDYVQIKPVFAKLDQFEWNGDDDGGGIVSGTIEIFESDGTVISTIKFENHTVGFVVHKPCEYCTPGETVP